MIKKIRKRSGFIGANITPAGIAIGLLIMTVISYFTLPLVAENRFNKHLDETKHQLEILVDGVIGTDGYMHNTVEPCSDAVTTVDLSAIRLNDCKGFTMFELVDSNTTDNNRDGTKSYFKLFQAYGENKIWFDNDPLDNTAFYVYIDFQSTKHADTIERFIGAFLRTTYTDSLRSIDWESTGLDNSTGGTKTDGKARFRFVK